MKCTVCSESMMGQEALLCHGCSAAHHYECWAYVGRCARYACNCKEAVPHTIPALQVVGGSRYASESKGTPQSPGDSLISGDWDSGWEVSWPPLKRVV